MLPLIGDEAIRAVVALEMMISGDYITPTLNGEIYLNKPPLFNWILIAVFRLSNANSEFWVRFPTTLFLLAYCLTIYYWISKKLGRQMGILASLVFLTCGRILFWDSFLGLIDVLYSWLMFTNFMIIGHYFEKRSHFRMFLFSYLLTAAGFLLKGVPSLAFQGITLLVVFIEGKKLRNLISWNHVAGISVLIIVCGTYYLFYYFRNPEYLDNAFLKLISESTQKSAIGSGITKTVIHLFTFPFEVIRHFFPWTLLIVFLFNKKIFRSLFQNPFIKYCILVFAANITIYWFSPVTYPRYLLMLVPLAFTVLLYAAKVHAFAKTGLYLTAGKIITLIFFAIAVSAVVLPVVFKDDLPVDHLYFKVFILLIMVLAIFLSFRHNQSRYGMFYYAVLLFLVIRISFNLFIIPYRQSMSWVTLCRSDAIKLGKATAGEQMVVMTDTITMHNVYYLTRERNDILRYSDSTGPGNWVIIDSSMVNSNFSKEFSMRVPYNYQTYYAGKFKD